MWESLSGALLASIQEWGEVAIFLLEKAELPLPLPGDLALIWVGYRAAPGQSFFVIALPVVELATLIGPRRSTGWRCGTVVT